MNPPSSSAWFPNEILEQIVLQAWSSPLAVDERISFMRSSLLVSKAWAVAFIRVSSRDVFVPCASYTDTFFRTLREESPIYDQHTRTLPNYLCRSITFQVHNTPVGTDATTPHDVRLFSDDSRAGQALAWSLYTIRSIGYLPNLRRVSIEYVNWGFDDISDHYRLVAFPDQVTELELKYTFTEGVPERFVDSLRSEYVRRECMHWQMPSVRRLVVVGAPDDMVRDLLSTCPNATMLVQDGSSIPLSDNSA